MIVATTSPARSSGATKRIVVAHDANYPPFAVLDPSGKPKGYIIDIWNAFGQKTGTEIVFKLGSWQESLDMVKNGEADAHGGLFFSEARERYMDFGPKLMNMTTSLFQRKGLMPVEIRTAPVGVIRGGYEEEFMRTKRPTQRLVLFEQNKAMIEAASKGKVQVFAAERPTAFHYLSLFGIRNNFEEVKKLYHEPLHLAVGKGRHKLLQDITDGWDKLDKQELRRIHDKWFMSKQSSGWLWPCAGVTLTILIVALVARHFFKRLHRVD